MSKTRWQPFLLAAACLLQLGLLLSLVGGAESTLERGRTWKFRTAPADPVDFFRGRYVTLRFPPAWVPLDPASAPVHEGQRVHVRLEPDDEGFARFAAATASPPETPDYLVLEADEVRSGRVRVRLAYDRFYMDEQRAPEVERLVRSGGQTSWAEVRVHEGEGMVVDLGIEEASTVLDPKGLRLWPEGTDAPDSLLTHLGNLMGVGLPQMCRPEAPCLLAAIDLDDDVEEEFLFTSGRPRQTHLLYYATRSDPDTGAEGWSLRILRFARGPMPSTVDDVVEALEHGGAHGEAPPRRWLRLGDALLDPTG